MAKPTSTSRQKRRTKWLASCTKWTRVGEQDLHQDVLITRLQRKPPFYALEMYDANGTKLKGVLKKLKGTGKGAACEKEPRWLLVLGKDAAKPFRTKKRALDFFSRLTVQAPEQPQSEGPAL